MKEMAFSTDAQSIINAEKELGFGFPEAFRAYLMAANGGSIEFMECSWQINPVFDKSDVKRLKRSTNHIVRETLAARQWRGFPSNAVTIASDGCGNHMVFLPNLAGTALQDSVYIWWHEESELEKIAENFHQLLS